MKTIVALFVSLILVGTIFSEKSYALSECKNAFTANLPAESSQTYFPRQLILEGRNQILLLGFSERAVDSLKVYFQEMFFNKGTAKEENRSRLLVLSEPLWIQKNEALRIGYVVTLVNGSKEVTIVRESKDANGDSYFSTTENSASLIIKPEIRVNGGKEAVAAAVANVVSSLSALYPSFRFIPLNFLGVVNAVAPPEATVLEKIQFISAIQQLSEVVDSAKLGFNIKDVIVGGRLNAPPANEVTNLDKIDLSELN